ncbi:MULTISPECIES: phage tail sheath family protein [unclassified Pseudomonas]|uniref:phage tail sheath family protein n=1 Tax=unclassified Pseudomonas TaxID=196821 RepID=UPI00385BABD6
MPAYTYPGVYIEEDATPGLSISSSATAVPVFAHDGTKVESDKLERVDSWLDFLGLVKKEANGKPDVEGMLYLSMEAYFQCGGGRAYLCQVKNLEKLVPAQDDITLLVSAGVAVTDTEFSSALGQITGAGKTVFAILDSIPTLTDSTDDMNEYTDSNNAAVYGPWLIKPGRTQHVPPSAAAAGLFAKTDNERGVWKAPANVALAGGLTPNKRFSEKVHGDYNNNEKPLNLFRTFPGGSTLLWGARTLSSNIKPWRYVSVRRLFDTVERDISRAMEGMMFEPNNQPTWEKVRAAAYNYLYSLWQQGALMGSKPELAFYINVGQGVTMTKTQIEAGKLVVEIGLNAVRPVEFIILKFTQNIGTP